MNSSIGKSIETSDERMVIGCLKSPPKFTSFTTAKFNKANTASSTATKTETIDLDMVQIPRTEYLELIKQASEAKKLRKEIAGLKTAGEIEMDYIYIDLQSPMETLKAILQQKTNRDLSQFEVWLQNVQVLEPLQTLVDMCHEAEEIAQVNVQILNNLKRINIVDVVKPTEEIVNAKRKCQDNIDSNIVMSETEQGIFDSNNSGQCTIFTIL